MSVVERLNHYEGLLNEHMSKPKNDDWEQHKKDLVWMIDSLKQQLSSSVGGKRKSRKSRKGGKKSKVRKQKKSRKNKKSKKSRK
jgi:hypothetical protein